MASILKVDTIQDQSGNNIINENAGTITIGKSGDTVNLASGATNNLGITEADQFRLTANLTANADPISANLERVDDATFSKIGTGMSLSSGVYTFPTTGLYQVEVTAIIQWTADQDSIQVEMYASSDSGSTYDQIARIPLYSDGETSVVSSSTKAFVNVTNASTFRVKFVLDSLDSGNFLSGSSTTNYTFFTFIRLGDSQ